MRVKRLILRFVLVCVVMVGLSVTLAALPMEQPAVGAAAWVQTLSPSARTAYLQDSVLRSLPSEYRRALVASIPRGQARATFWTAAFAAYRDSHSLSALQVAAFNQAISQFPEAIAALDGTRRSGEPYRTLVAHLRDALGPAEVDELMYKTSASAVGPVQLPISERVRYELRRLRLSFKTEAGLLDSKPDCNCTEDPECGGGWYCDREIACENTTTGCGAGGEFECFGYCLPDPNKPTR